MTAGVDDSPFTASTSFSESFRRDGFGVVRGALASAESERMRQRLAAMVTNANMQGPEQLEVQLPRLVELHEQFAALAIAPQLIGVLGELFGTVPLLVNSYGHVKPARTGAHTGVHSDVAHLRGVPHHASTLMVKAMYALTPVGVTSGATVVYPGTHLLPTPDLGDPHLSGVHILLDSGDLVLFHTNLLHTATANPSRTPRLSLWFSYAQPWMRVFPGHEYSSVFLDSMRTTLEASPAAACVFGLSNPYSTRP